jgi:hypothetical protein
VDDPDLWNSRTSLKVLWAGVARTMRPLFDLMCTEASDDTVIAGHRWAFGARFFQEKYGVPMVTLQVSPSTFLSASGPPIHKQLRIPLFLSYPVRAGLLWAFERGVLDRVCGPDISRLRAELGLPPFDGSWVGGGNLSLHRFRLEATCMVMGTIVVLFNPSEQQVTNLIRIKQLCAQVIAIDNSPSSDHKQHAQIEAGCRCLRWTPRGGQFWGRRLRGVGGFIGRPR